MVAAGAPFGRLGPVGRGRKIRRPKRPCAALTRPNLVYAAFAGIGIEQNAVAVRSFDEAFANSHRADELPLELFDVTPEDFGHRLDFGLVDPNIARFAGTATTATGAGKFQTFFVPMAAHY